MLTPQEIYDIWQYTDCAFKGAMSVHVRNMGDEETQEVSFDQQIVIHRSDGFYRIGYWVVTGTGRWEPPDQEFREIEEEDTESLFDVLKAAYAWIIHERMGELNQYLYEEAMYQEDKAQEVVEG
jgi:hypothetical protein